MTEKTIARRAVGLLLCVLLVSSVSAAPVAASGHPEEEFRVELDAEGDADVAVTYTYDLETDSEQVAFAELQGNATAREELATRFENRMAAVAADASDATGREMAVTDASAEVTTVHGVGVLTLSVRWEGLAAVDGDRLTVTEPFASGFEPDRTVTVVAPDGYAVTSATPDPSSDGAATASWAAGTSLEGFELVTEPSDGGTDGDGDTEGLGAGFGAATAATGLVGTVLLARRRRT
jgi:hypothetical protein